MNPEHVKSAVDAGSIGTLLATIAGWLPHVAALFTIVWTGVRIYESKTCQRLLGRKEP